MASGDVRQSRGRGGSGGGSMWSYNDEGRGNSKNAWEWFEAYYTANNFTDESLLAVPDANCYQLVRYSTMRFGVEDITNYPYLDRGENEDSRASRIITLKSPKKRAMWMPFHTHLIEGYTREKLRLEEQRKRDYQNYEERDRLARIAREAEVVKMQRELEAEVNKVIDLTAGSMRSEFASAFSYEETHYQRSGDYLEDVTEGYISGQGFSEETQRPGGVKIQITLSIDLSNSMYYNNIHDSASKAFFELGVSLKAMHAEYPDDLFTAFFAFSDGAEGKYAGRLSKDGEVRSAGSWQEAREDNPGKVELAITGPNLTTYELSKFNKFQHTYNIFQGEDTWISPLFNQIEQWENKYGDPGAARLDIIITDAVLEHVADIREADKIQERRDGNLQTVLLNFMPEANWSDGTLPKRCVQYKADTNNISGLLRHIISDFISTSI